MEKQKVLKRRTFNLMGSRWTIKYVDVIKSDDNESFVYGQTIHNKRTVLVATKDISEDEQRLALYHELFHAVLSTGQYLNSCNDEPLVEWLARSLDCLKRNKIV